MADEDRRKRKDNRRERKDDEKKERKGNGRKKVPIVRMTNESHRDVTFSKRRSGLFKKASELCTLCDCTIAIIVFSAVKRVYSFGHPEVMSVINRFLGRNSIQQQENMIQSLVDVRRNRYIYELHAEVANVEECIKAERSLGERLDQMMRTQVEGWSSNYWWYEPVEQLDLESAEYMLAKFEELKANISIGQTERSIMESFVGQSGRLPIPLLADQPYHAVDPTGGRGSSLVPFGGGLGPVLPLNYADYGIGSSSQVADGVGGGAPPRNYVVGGSVAPTFDDYGMDGISYGSGAPFNVGGSSSVGRLQDLPYNAPGSYVNDNFGISGDALGGSNNLGGGGFGSAALIPYEHVGSSSFGISGSSNSGVGVYGDGGISGISRGGGSFDGVGNAGSSHVGSTSVGSGGFIVGGPHAGGSFGGDGMVGSSHGDVVSLGGVPIAGRSHGGGGGFPVVGNSHGGGVGSSYGVDGTSHGGGVGSSFDGWIIGPSHSGGNGSYGYYRGDGIGSSYGGRGYYRSGGVAYPFNIPDIPSERLNRPVVIRENGGGSGRGTGGGNIGGGGGGRGAYSRSSTSQNLGANDKGKAPM